MARHARADPGAGHGHASTLAQYDHGQSRPDPGRHRTSIDQEALGSTWSTWTPRSAAATTPRSSPRSPRTCGSTSSCPAASGTTTAWSARWPPAALGSTSVPPRWSDPGGARRSSAAYGDRIAIGLDVRGTSLAARGWTREGGDLYETLERLNAAGCARYVVTDVNSDGMLSGPNPDLLRRVCERPTPPSWPAAGSSLWPTSRRWPRWCPRCRRRHHRHRSVRGQLHPGGGPARRRPGGAGAPTHEPRRPPTPFAGGGSPPPNAARLARAATGGCRDLLAGKKIVMTGVTGFIGEQLLWKILTELPDTTPVGAGPAQAIGRCPGPDDLAW